MGSFVGYREGISSQPFVNPALRQAQDRPPYGRAGIHLDLRVGSRVEVKMDSSFRWNDEGEAFAAVTKDRLSLE
jgi:hypothetical protein